MEVNNIKLTKKEKWLYERLLQYRSIVEASPIHPRGLFYFIVDLSEEDRTMWFEKDGSKHLFIANNSNYKGLDSTLTDMRVKGIIPNSWIIDEKNDAITTMPDIIQLEKDIRYWNKDSKDLPEFENNLDNMEDFEEFCDIKVHSNIQNTRFTHQDYHIALVFEKKIFTEDLEQLSRRYGCDFIAFSGQPSLTRIYEICERSNKRDLPLLVLYGADLDPSGYAMQDAFMKRVSQFKPNYENKCIRILLNRDQVEKYQIHESISDKKIPEVTFQKFEEISGSRKVVELNALRKPILISIVEDALKEYSGIEQDKEENKQALEEFDELSDKINEEIKNMDKSEFEQDYNDIKDEFNSIIDEIKEFYDNIREKIASVKEKSDNYMNRFNDKINEIIIKNKEENKEEEDNE